MKPSKTEPSNGIKKRKKRTPPGASVWDSVELNQVIKDILFNKEAEEEPEKKPPSNYNRYVLSFVLFFSGAALMLEHLITWQGFDYSFGHEWAGLILIIISFVVGLKKR